MSDVKTNAAVHELMEAMRMQLLRSVQLSIDLASVRSILAARDAELLTLKTARKDKPPNKAA